MEFELIFELIYRHPYYYEPTYEWEDGEWKVINNVYRFEASNMETALEKARKFIEESRKFGDYPKNVEIPNEIRLVNYPIELKQIVKIWPNEHI